MNNGIAEDIEMIAEALLVDDCGDLLRSDSLDWENVKRLPQYQQILNNQAIVEKLKIELKSKHDTWYNNGCYNLLKEILNTTHHSGGKP